MLFPLFFFPIMVSFFHCNSAFIRLLAPILSLLFDFPGPICSLMTFGNGVLMTNSSCTYHMVNYGALDTDLQLGGPVPLHSWGSYTIGINIIDLQFGVLEVNVLLAGCWCLGFFFPGWIVIGGVPPLAFFPLSIAVLDGKAWCSCGSFTHAREPL